MTWTGWTAVLFVAGSAFMAFVSYRQKPFVASPTQFAATAAIVGVLTIAAFLADKS